MIEVKHIKGEGYGTRMDWLCAVHENEGFGFAGKAITCIDMTVHAPEHDRPNVVFSTYLHKTSPESIRYEFMPHAYDSIEQLKFATEIINNWNKIKNGEAINVEKR